jgi:hypothetical protein
MPPPQVVDSNPFGVDRNTRKSPRATVFRTLLSSALAQAGSTVRAIGEEQIALSEALPRPLRELLCREDWWSDPSVAIARQGEPPRPPRPSWRSPGHRRKSIGQCLGSVATAGSYPQPFRRYGNERRDSVKSTVLRRLLAPMSSAAGALRSSTVRRCVALDTGWARRPVVRCA